MRNEARERADAKDGVGCVGARAEVELMAEMDATGEKSCRSGTGEKQHTNTSVR